MGENSVKNKVRPQNKHLKPFKKGDPRINRAGHPLGQPNYSTLREMAIRQLAKLNNKTPIEIDIEITANALLEARKGNFQFYKDDKDRTYGTPLQKSTMEITLPKPIADVFVNNGIQDSKRNEEDSES